MKMIPISEIDSLITKCENFLSWLSSPELSQILTELQKIKQKAIASIPISKIDEKIKELSFDTVGECNCENCHHIRYAVRMLEDLKK